MYTHSIVKLNLHYQVKQKLLWLFLIDYFTYSPSEAKL